VNDALRAQLAALLDWKDAHVGFDSAVEGVAPELRGVVPRGLPYSLWQLVEHLRICQRDILDFCINPDYVELPADRYFAPDAAPPSPQAWEESLEACRRDRGALERLVADPGIDLHARIPHGTGQTYLREILLVADHNAYTTGQIIVVRRLLGIWE
jgi:hypothetical protein